MSVDEEGVVVLVVRMVMRMVMVVRMVRVVLRMVMVVSMVMVVWW